LTVSFSSRAATVGLANLTVALSPEVCVSPSVLPLISSRDYPRFQQIIRELADTTYEEWQGDHAKAVAYRKSHNGFKEVPVTADEFDRWLKKTQQAAHLELLWVFAEEKA
jgi:hypothetical protein